MVWKVGECHATLLDPVLFTGRMTTFVVNLKRTGRVFSLLRQEEQISGRSSAWLERLLWEQEVARSNRVAPTQLDFRPFGEFVKRLSLFYD